MRFTELQRWPTKALQKTFTAECELSKNGKNFQIASSIVTHWEVLLRIFRYISIKVSEKAISDVVCTQASCSVITAWFMCNVCLY